MNKERGRFFRAELIGLVAWLVGLGVLWVGFLCCASFEKMFEDLGGPLPYTTTLVLGVASFARSEWGIATTLGILVYSVALYTMAPKHRTVLFLFIGLASLAFAWLTLSVFALFMPLIRTVETMK